VQSLGQCNQLPASLQDGCKWRFNWAGGESPSENSNDYGKKKKKKATSLVKGPSTDTGYSHHDRHGQRLVNEL